MILVILELKIRDKNADLPCISDVFVSSFFNVGQASCLFSLHSLGLADIALNTYMMILNCVVFIHFGLFSCHYICSCAE